MGDSLINQGIARKNTVGGKKNITDGPLGTFSHLRKEPSAPEQQLSSTGERFFGLLAQGLPLKICAWLWVWIPFSCVKNTDVTSPNAAASDHSSSWLLPTNF